MKKLLLYFCLFSLTALGAHQYTYNEYDNMKISLKLSEKQLKKIEKIEEKYDKKLAEINSQIILTNMQIAKYRHTASYADIYNSLNIQIKNLNSQYNDLYQNKNKDILSALNFFQRIKFKKFISR